MGSRKGLRLLRDAWVAKVADALGALYRAVRRRQEGLVFPDPDGQPWLDHRFRKLWCDAMTISDVRYRPPKHMRHTYATLALAAGLPLEFISKQLRHSELETTRKHYARWLRSAD